MMDKIFYVYEHWRPDEDLCFWVGKGHGKRAYNFKRNFHYNHVVRKLSRLGMCVEVRLVKSAMAEADAFALEIERIAFWRAAGIKLTNYSDGGEGAKGSKRSPEVRALIRAYRKKQKIVHSEETKRKISAAHIGIGKGKPTGRSPMKGRKHRPESRQKISESSMGRLVSEETRAKISAAHTGQKRSAHARENMRLAQVGKKHAPETRRKMSESQFRRWAAVKEST